MDTARPVEAAINRKLQEAFQPVTLIIENESYKHCVPKDSETHFKVRLYSCTSYIFINATIRYR